MGFFSSLFDRFRKKPNKEDAFAQLITEALKRAGERREVRYDQGAFRLVYLKDGEHDGMVNLHNLFLEHSKLEAGERQAWLKRTVMGLAKPMDIPEDFEDAKPDILPTLRTRSMAEIMRLDALISSGKALELSSVPVCDHLVACFVYDLPNTMQFIGPDHVQKWGVSLYELLEIAIENLDQLPYSMMGLGETMYVIANGDAYDASRLLLKDRIRQLELKGKPVAIPVTRDKLLITGADDPEGIELMLKMVEMNSEDARPLCQIPVFLDGDNWEIWPIPEGHSKYAELRELHYKYFYGEYTTQKKQLEERNEQTGVDVFVATYSVLDRAGTLMSYCTWPKNCPTWLPKTDYVALVDTDTDESWMVPWATMAEQLGYFLKPLEHYPPRWSVNDFPEKSQVEKLGAVNWKGQ